MYQPRRVKPARSVEGLTLTQREGVLLPARHTDGTHRQSGRQARGRHGPDAANHDELGLVRPSQRSEAGYRLYEDRALEGLQQVLFFRELGFPLEEIARLVNDPS